jgi:hypothetical protein
MLIKGDLEQAHRIYGEQLEYVRGRMVKKMVRRVLADASLIAVHKAPSPKHVCRCNAHRQEDISGIGDRTFESYVAEQNRK